MIVRKISIGPDYKNGAMHYIVGQTVLSGSHTIEAIKINKEDLSCLIYIKNQSNEIFLWKKFNQSMPMSIEFDIEFNPQD